MGTLRTPTARTSSEKMESMMIKKSKTSRVTKKFPQNSPAPAGYFGTEGKTRKEPLGKAQMAAYWG